MNLLRLRNGILYFSYLSLRIYYLQKVIQLWLIYFKVEIEVILLRKSERLQGEANFVEWAIKMKDIMVYLGVWNYICPNPGQPIEISLDWGAYDGSRVGADPCEVEQQARMNIAFNIDIEKFGSIPPFDSRTLWSTLNMMFSGQHCIQEKSPSCCWVLMRDRFLNPADTKGHRDSETVHLKHQALAALNSKESKDSLAKVFLYNGTSLISTLNDANFLKIYQKYQSPNHLNLWLEGGTYLLDVLSRPYPYGRIWLLIGEIENSM